MSYNTLGTKRPPCATLRKIVPEDRHDIAITYVSNADGKQLTLSKYEDHKWDFAPYIHNKNSGTTFINFDCDITPGFSLISEHHHRFLNSSKSFIYARWLAKSPRTGKFIKAATLMSDWSNLKALIRWMDAFNLMSFGELTPKLCMQYAHSIIGDPSIKQRLKISRLEVVELLYSFRHQMDSPMVEHPWPEQTAFTLIGARRTEGMYDVKTELIPRRIYEEIGKQALAFIECESERILRVWTAFHTAYRDEIELAEYHVEKRLKAGSSKRNQPLDKAIYEIARVRALSKMKPSLLANGFKHLTELDTEVRFLRTCCYVIIAMFSGMRDSEITSLQTNCFESSTDMSGELYYWLHGLTYKLEDQPKPAKWMVPGVVEKAVNVAVEIKKPLVPYIGFHPAEIASSNAQLINQNDDSAILLNNLFVSWKALGTRPEFLQNNSTNLQLKSLSERFNLLVNNEDLSEVIDRNSIVPDKYWPLATHQFRRTFAVFVARNVLGDVRYLRHHFKHWSIDMTLHYAKDPLFDDTLFDAVMSKRDELQANIVAGWLTPGHDLAGGRAQDIARFRGRAEIKTAKDPQSLAKAVGEGIFIRGTGHSWCLATTKGCGGEGLYDAIRCTNCAEGVIDQNHLIIWQRIREQQIEVLSWPDLGDPAWERAGKHLREAERVLSELGHTVTPHPLPEPPSRLFSPPLGGEDEP